MTFRADEAARTGYASVENYLIGRDIKNADRERSQWMLRDIVTDLGPVVSSYPLWHPLLSKQGPDTYVTEPGHDTGYKGLDHTVHFANGFITCPYHIEDAERVIESVKSITSPAAVFMAQILDVKFYHHMAVPVLVNCGWLHAPLADGTVPLEVAGRLLLERELLRTKNADYAESWETMRPYLLGSPHGARSSIFVNQETGSVLKRIWNDLNDAGLFSPAKQRRRRS